MPPRQDAFLYQIYGLTLCANRLLPGLAVAPEGTSIDVTVDLSGNPPEQIASVPPAVWRDSPNRCLRDESWFRLWAVDCDDGRYFRLRYTDEGNYADYVISPTGSRVWGSWNCPHLATEENFASVLTKRVLGCVLRVRGVACLHAGVVAVDNRGFAILGNNRVGKSTTTAALAERGCLVLTDDLAALADRRKVFYVQPGAPRLSLWPRAIEALNGDTGALPRILSNSEKRYVDLAESSGSRTWRFQPEPLPLAAIYVLGRYGERQFVPSIETLPTHTGLMKLIENSYANYILDSAGRRCEFDVLGRLAASVPIRQVHRPKGLDFLPQLCDVILADARGLI